MAPSPTPSSSASSQPAADLAKESAAGEEDPGSAIDAHSAVDGPVSAATGRAPCAECGGSGRAESGGRCPACDGLGTVAAGTYGPG